MAAEQPKKLFRVLALDGGDAKGIYTLGVLKEIEGMLGCKVFRGFVRRGRGGWSLRQEKMVRELESQGRSAAWTWTDEGELLPKARRPAHQVRGQT
jgi:hypothetical protein